MVDHLRLFRLTPVDAMYAELVERDEQIRVLKKYLNAAQNRMKQVYDDKYRERTV